MNYVLLILALAQTPPARADLTPEEITVAIRNGQDVPVTIRGQRIDIAGASSSLARLTARSGALSARISGDGSSVTLTDGSKTVQRIESREVSDIALGSQGAWPDYKTFNDTLYTWNKGCRIDLGEVVATNDGFCVSFFISAMFPSSHAQAGISAGLFKFDRNGIAIGSVRAWEFDAPFAVQGHRPSASVLCRVFVQVSDRLLAVVKTSPEGFRVWNLASGKTLVDRLDYRLIGVVGSHVLFRPRANATDPLRILCLDLSTMTLQELGSPGAFLHIAAVGSDGALLIENTTYSTPHAFLAHEKALVPVLTK